MSLVVSDAEVKDGLVIQILRRPTKWGVVRTMED